MQDRFSKRLKSFTDAMQDKLNRREHHGDWRFLEIKECWELLKDECVELHHEMENLRLHRGKLRSIQHECVDVANCAMILFDKISTLKDEFDH